MEEFMGIILVLGLVAIALWIWAIIDMVRGGLRGDVNKIVWTAIVIFFPIVGVILYYALGRKSTSY